MYDPDAPSSRLVATELKKKDVMQALRDSAMWRAKVEWDAKDLLANALVRVFDPDDAPWAPSERSLVTHMSLVMKKVWYRQQRKKAVEAEVSDGGVAQETTAKDQARVDDEAERARSLEVQRRLGERVLVRLEKGGRAHQVFDLGMREDLETSEMADRLQCSVAEIRAAEKQLAYHGRIVLDEWNASEERRMSALREAARQKPQPEEGTP